MIRTMTAADLPAIRALIDAVGLFDGAMVDDMAAPFLKGQDSGGRWLVSDLDGVIAVAWFLPEPMTDGTWNLQLIAAQTENQGQGQGTLLVHHIEQLLTEQNQRVLLVETSGLPEYSRTRRFYRKIGYEEVARIADYYASGDDKVIFRKAL